MDVDTRAADVAEWFLAPAPDVKYWLANSGLEILLLVLGGVLLTRVLAVVADRITDGIDVRSRTADELVRSEESKHRHALAQVLRYVAIALVWTIVGLKVVERLGVNLTTLVAPATVAGAALGFGAQRIVQDMLAGFFLITERQYGYGDVIEITVVGGLSPSRGTVEDVTLRVTRIRTLDGEVVTFPNGQIVKVVNLSRDWARAVVDVPVPPGVDMAEVNRVLHEVGERLYADPEIEPLLLDEPSLMGVESLGVDQVVLRMVARTLPGRQFEVGRRLRAGAAASLRQAGLIGLGDVERVIGSDVGEGRP